MRHESLSFVTVRWIVRRMIIPLFMDLRVTGLDNTPKTGAFIAASNHISMVDVPVIMAVLPRRPSLMAKSDLYRYRFLHWFWRWGGAVQVNRNVPDRAALRLALDLIEKGIPFGIFPEGTRIRAGGLGPGMPGVGMLALRSGAPVLPIALTGTPKVFEGRRPHLRPRVTLSIGAVISPEELRAAGGSTAATELVMRRIAELLPPQVRGVYGQSGVKALSVKS